MGSIPLFSRSKLSVRCMSSFVTRGYAPHVPGSSFNQYVGRPFTVWIRRMRRACSRFKILVMSGLPIPVNSTKYCSEGKTMSARPHPKVLSKINSATWSSRNVRSWRRISILSAAPRSRHVSNSRAGQSTHTSRCGVSVLGMCGQRFPAASSARTALSSCLAVDDLPLDACFMLSPLPVR